MINLKNELSGLTPIKLTLDLPQVGSRRYNYTINNGEIISEKDNRLVDFIVNDEYDLMLGRGHHKLNDKKEHVIMAGMLRIKNGKICEINNDSGHFTPQKTDFMNFVNRVKDNHYFTDLIVDVIDWSKHDKS